MSPLPLDGITVLALEHAVAAPFATRQLADLGARVIKVERPGVGDFAREYDRSVHGQASYFVWLNRGKESVELDLKDPTDRALLDTVVAGADVVLQNLLPGAVERLGLDADTLPGATLPPPAARPFFSLLDDSLSEEIRRQIRRPFWIDTVSRSNIIEIRIALKAGVIRVLARRSQAYASNSHIFFVWMVGTSLVLTGVAILFLRNQIRPILKLAAAAEDFGRGREVEFRPRGAREVRQAGHAFIEMKRRIARAMEQRTTMLNGVSHDLRTILTRFRLSLALVPDSPEIEDLRRDVDEMGRMLEGYLAFARGDTGEPAVTTDLATLLAELQTDAERAGHRTTLDIAGDPTITVRPDAFRRLLFNLVSNAARHGEEIALSAQREGRWLSVSVDDDGPGIPSEEREEVFKPFVRLDEARNQDEGGSGLGLPIARDIARAHGGDVTLGDSPLGGLRATVRLPA